MSQVRQASRWARLRPSRVLWAAGEAVERSRGSETQPYELDAAQGRKKAADVSFHTRIAGLVAACSKGLGGKRKASLFKRPPKQPGRVHLGNFTSSRDFGDQHPPGSIEHLLFPER